jgi:diacylglycerol kinase family enzyme
VNSTDWNRANRVHKRDVLDAHTAVGSASPPASAHPRRPATEWLAIVNPRSGGARNRSTLARILKRLRHVAAKIVYTEGPGHAQELAACAVADRGLAVVGGDGTLHEVLTGAGRRPLRVALVPTGRGNSLARDLGLTSALLGIQAMEAGWARRIDLLDIRLEDENGRRRSCFSASTVALGYPVAVTRRAEHFRGLGRLCYLAAAVVESACPRSFAIEVSYDGGRSTSRRLNGLIVNNTRHLANFVGFPDAACDDGALDVMELDAGFVRQNLHNLSALCGSRIRCGSQPFRSKAVDVRLAEPSDVMVDGQIYVGVTSLQIAIAPAAVECQRLELGART